MALRRAKSACMRTLHCPHTRYVHRIRTKYLVGVRMSSTGEAMPGLERQRWLDRVAQSGGAMKDKVNRVRDLLKTLAQAGIAWAQGDLDACDNTPDHEGAAARVSV